ncbi:beta-ketoacyl reductase, partial [Amycolatopsis anabasis]|uniref:beta-ketoacyl reductase n=1 Tax=Amycolatopsis anabasis TaxID=1840409 RepID=UPI00131A9CB6
TRFLEIGPDGVLTAMAQDCVADSVLVSALRRDRDEPRTLLTALAAVHAQGIGVDWAAWFSGTGTRRIDLPTYAFQRRRYWLEEPPAGAGSHASTVDGWRYQLAWQPAGLGGAELSGTWLVVTPPGVSAEGCPDALTRSGADVAVLEFAAGEEFAAVAGKPIAGVVSLLSLDTAAHRADPALPRGLAATVDLIGALDAAGVDAPLWCVTRGAIAIRPEETADPVQALYWGLGRSAALEQPRSWGGLADLPGNPSADDWSRLVRAIAGAGTEDQLAVRPSGTFTSRLVRPPHRSGAPRPWQASGTALVTGGTGAVGAHVARWLARTGAEHIVLASRRGPDAEGAGELTAELEELGARVTVAACDVADRDALRALLARIDGEPLTTVVHAAGVLDDGLLGSMTAERLATVLRAKVRAAANLDELTRDRELAAFVLFSSVAGTFGNAGQAGYAAANAALDALARRRRAHGLPATSVAWGMWAGGGMADATIADRAVRRGVAGMAPELALSALQQALERDETDLVVADVDWPRLVPELTAARPNRLFDALPGARDAAAANPAAPRENAARQRILAAPAGERERILLDLVRDQVAAVLGHESAAQVDTARGFLDLGFDSLTAVELRNRLNTLLGLDLPTTLVFYHPTPAELVRRLNSELGQEEEERTGGTEIDRLEAVLGSLPPEDAAHREIVTRLEDLLAKWGNTRADDELAAATNEEIFSLIDDEFGSS